MSTLAFALAATIKHDGQGGVADLLATPAETTAWLDQHHDLVTEVLGRPLEAVDDKGSDDAAVDDGGLDDAAEDDAGVDDEGVDARDAQAVVRDELVRVRRAVRALFARAVAPEPPSKADADRLMDADAALRLVNRAADRLGTMQLDWPDDSPPVTRWAGRTEDPVALLVAAVGRSTIDFLSGPDRVRLRACPAARCVKYFLQDDPRQLWCSPSCGNRERVNRHYRKRHGL
ncbi:ABATE domain-containing protein [Kribbella sp. NBC_01484]|uniref:ABATE domain-containing protein n=1 Tax=Kribbella sp. NBC_01484 TaxID=2903579 RepID=UPI002E35CCCA|nr:ABATE domain-containing protein [Kribbella sp. NBC_01484]